MQISGNSTHAAAAAEAFSSGSACATAAVQASNNTDAGCLGYSCLVVIQGTLLQARLFHLTGCTAVDVKRWRNCLSLISSAFRLYESRVWGQKLSKLHTLRGSGL